MCLATTTIPPQQQQHDDTIWILDGGTGREIERRGGPFRQPEWSALALYDDPNIVKDIHKSFLEAGANYITTNTYAIVPFHLGRERYNRDAKRLLELATDLAVQARDGHSCGAKVMGSIPPISGSYQPGSFDEAIAMPIIHDFLGAFHGKVDAIILETMGSAQEAKFALEQIQQSQIKVPVFLSFYVEENESKPLLLTGDSLSQAMDLLQEANLLDMVALVMVNCCDIYLVDAALKELSHYTATTYNKFRIGAYPNAFSAPPNEAANVKAREINENISPNLLQSMAQKWIRDYGATAVGGCCGIGPEHIRAVARLQQQQQQRAQKLPLGEVGNTNSVYRKTEKQQQDPPPICCRRDGCGCGVQIGFGQPQQPPSLLFCGATSSSSSEIPGNGQ